MLNKLFTSFHRVKAIPLLSTENIDQSWQLQFFVDHENVDIYRQL